MSEKTLDTEIRYYEDGTQATAENLNKPLEDLAKTGQYMSQAQFEKDAETNRGIYAGSGYVEWHKDLSNNGAFARINDGLYTRQGSALLDPGYNNKIFTKDVRTSNNYLPNKDIKLNINGSMINFNAPEMIVGAYQGFELPEAPKTFSSENSISISKDIKKYDYLTFGGTNLNEKVEDMSASNWHDISSNGILEDYDGGIKLTQKSGIDCWAFYNIGGLIKGAKYKISVNVTERTHTGRITVRVNELGSYQYTWGAKGKIDIEFIASSNTDTIRIQMHDAPAVDSYTVYKDLSVALVENKIYLTTENILENTQVTEIDTLINVDSISRQDLVFLETWHELIQEKDIVYPYGNIQYKGSNTNGLSGITEGAFSGAETYSLFGNWQEAGDLIGLGYVWSTLSQEDKLKFSSNKDNNVYMSKDGLVQVRYRVRVVQGLGNNWSNLERYFGAFDTIKSTTVPKGKLTYNNEYNNTGISAGFWVRTGEEKITRSKKNIELGSYTGRHDSFYNVVDSYGNTDVIAIPIALVQRRNQGAFDPVWNPEGSSVFSDGKAWYETSASHNNLIDCFNNAGTGDIASGVSGRPDGLYYDEVNERDIEDLRMSAHKVQDKQGYLEEQFNKAMADNIRGTEGEWRFDGFMDKTVTTIESFYFNEGNNKSIEFNVTEIDYLTLSLPNSDTSCMIHIIGNNGNSYTIKRHEYTNTKLIYFTYTTARVYFYDFGTSYDVKKLNELFPVGTTLKIGFSYKTGVNYSFTKTHTDIIGDPRKISERIKYSTISGDDKTGIVKRGTYIKAGDNYYVSNINRGETPITIDPDTEDYTNITNWYNLGTDGSIGGYTQEWNKNGINGTPLITDENGLSLYPSDSVVTNDWSNAFLTNVYSENSLALTIKLSRVGHYFYEVLVRKADGEFIKYSPNTWTLPLAYEGGISNTEIRNTKLLLNIGHADTLSALGYSTVEEALAKIVVLVSYKSKSKFLELSNNIRPEVVSDNCVASCYRKGYGAEITYNLLDKVPYNKYSGTFPNSFVSFSAKIDNINLDLGYGGANGRINASGYGGYAASPSHIPIVMGRAPVVSKFLPYLINLNGKAYINFLFKELKWDDSVDDDSEFTNISGDTVSSHTLGEKLFVTSGKHQGYWECTKNIGDYSFDDDRWAEINEELVWVHSDGNTYFKRWNGNGYGDNDQFEILLNGIGTKQDDNNQFVFYGQKRLKLNRFLD